MKRGEHGHSGVPQNSRLYVPPKSCLMGRSLLQDFLLKKRAVHTHQAVHENSSCKPSKGATGVHANRRCCYNVALPRAYTASREKENRNRSYRSAMVTMSAWPTPKRKTITAGLSIITPSVRTTLHSLTLRNVATSWELTLVTATSVSHLHGQRCARGAVCGAHRILKQVPGAKKHKRQGRNTTW